MARYGQLKTPYGTTCTPSGSSFSSPTALHSPTVRSMARKRFNRPFPRRCSYLRDRVARQRRHGRGCEVVSEIAMPELPVLAPPESEQLPSGVHHDGVPPAAGDLAHGLILMRLGGGWIGKARKQSAHEEEGCRASNTRRTMQGMVCWEPCKQGAVMVAEEYELKEGREGE